MALGKTFINQRGQTPLIFLSAMILFVMIGTSCALRHFDDAVAREQAKNDPKKYRAMHSRGYDHTATQNISIIKLPEI